MFPIVLKPHLAHSAVAVFLSWLWNDDLILLASKFKHGDLLFADAFFFFLFVVHVLDVAIPPFLKLHIILSTLQVFDVTLEYAQTKRYR